MIKLIYCIRKRSDLTEQQFAEYWRTVHASLGARIPGLRRLVQNHLKQVPGDLPPTFDGVAELWFEDETSLLAARESPEWAASTADEAHFVDPERYGYLVAEEVEIALPATSSPPVREQASEPAKSVG